KSGRHRKGSGEGQSTGVGTEPGTGQSRRAEMEAGVDDGAIWPSSGAGSALAEPCLTQDQSSRWQELCFAGLSGVLVRDAFRARLHTLHQDDLFWMLATARWIIQHREIPWTDHFSYTAQGQPWIYPVGGSLLFYGVWLIGGYAALSWLGAVSTAAAAALLL